MNIHQSPRIASRFRLGTLLAALTVVAGGAFAGDTPVEILWDKWGIPHVYSDDEAGVFYGAGWAQMHNHGNLLLQIYGQSRGRAAEYWGQSYADSDKWVWTMGIPQRAEEWTEAQSPKFTGFLQAFVNGINDYAEQHPDDLRDDLERVLPVTIDDVMAHFQRVIHFYFVTRPQAVDAASRELGQLGSNTWALSPDRTTSGNTFLLANPHLPWADFFTFFEMHLVGPGVNVYGATLVGWPTPGIAFNQHLGWSHTVNTHDGADFYELTLVDGGYEWNDGVRQFDTQTHALKVSDGNGGYREERITVVNSVHGPVVARSGNKALALRVVGLDRPNIPNQYWDMMRATNLEAFEAALSQIQMPMFTVMYADRDGHIMHLFGGATPVRPKGDYNWSGIVPGNTSKTLWTEIHPYEDLPRVVDPESGWLQNANDPPWTTTFPRAIDPDDYPPYMAPRFMGFRPQQSAKLLMADDSISFSEFETYKHSTRMELADRILDDLEDAVDTIGGRYAREAITVLKRWDRRADADSEGAVLFRAFAEALQDRQRNFFATPWDPARPLETPDGLKSPEDAVAALVVAYHDVTRRYGRPDVAWGEVNRLRIGGNDLPANGGTGGLGIFRVVNYQNAEKGKQTGFGGDSYVCITEFGDTVRARALMTYGNATQPHTGHVGDQLRLFAKQKLRPVWLTRKEVEANLEKREVL